MIYRNWEHYWAEGNHGFTSSSRDLAKETWDDFEETLLASQDDYKKAYIQLCEDQAKTSSEMQDAMIEYIKIHIKDGSPGFWRWWSNSLTLTSLPVEPEDRELLPPEDDEDEIVSQDNPNPEIIVMVGLPASGKSTYREEHYPYHTVVSWDDLVVEMYPATTYDESFKLSEYKVINSALKKRLQSLCEANYDIVVDLTMLSKNVRLKRLSGVPKRYSMIAVVCQTSIKKLEERNVVRSKDGKTIPTAVFQNMAKSFQMPTLAEGFSEVVRNLT